MRNEYVDMSELVRRFEEKIYSESEFKRAKDVYSVMDAAGPMYGKI